MFFLHHVTQYTRSITNTFKSAPLSRKLAVTALLSAIACLLQASGGFFPVVGLLISPFATAPIIICSILNSRYGFLCYLLTMALLTIMQPSEVIVFPFTTGLLGLGIGLSFHLLNRRISLILSGALALFLGILFLLTIVHFPVLGPSIRPNIRILLPLFLFTLVYSWLWLELTVFFSKRLFFHDTPNDTGH